MLEIDHYIAARNLEEAYNVLQSQPGATILGGCGYIRLGSRKIKTAIDLAGLDLNFIRETDQSIEIGAMTPLRQLERSTTILHFADGLLSESVKNIVGVQLRSCVTLGGSVAGRFPFSDPIAALLALDAQVEFYKFGTIALQQFINGKAIRDILTKIIIPKRDVRGAFQSMRKIASDYPILNVAVTKSATGYRVVVGSRPGKATLVEEAARYLKENQLNAETIKEAGKLTAQSITFGNNSRGSREYRQAICPVLVSRALIQIEQENNHAA